MSFLNNLLHPINAIILALLAAIGITGLCGCNQPPIEKFAAKFADDIVKPAVSEGIKQGIGAFTLQAGAQGINPTYVVHFEGYWVTGIKGMASIGVQGLSGQMQVTTQGNENTKTSPHATSMPN